MFKEILGAFFILYSAFWGQEDILNNPGPCGSVLFSYAQLTSSHMDPLRTKFHIFTDAPVQKSGVLF